MVLRGYPVAPPCSCLLFYCRIQCWFALPCEEPNFLSDRFIGSRFNSFVTPQCASLVRVSSSHFISQYQLDSTRIAFGSYHPKEKGQEFLALSCQNFPPKAHAICVRRRRFFWRRQVPMSPEHTASGPACFPSTLPTAVSAVSTRLRLRRRGQTSWHRHG